MLCVARRSRVHDLSLLQPTPKSETHVFVVWWILSGVGEGGCGDTSSLDYEALLRSLAKRLLRNAETTNSLIRMVVQDTNLVAAKLRIHWWRTLKYVFEQQAALSLAPPLSCILLIRVTTVVSHFLSLSLSRKKGVTVICKTSEADPESSQRRTKGIVQARPTHKQAS